MSIRRTGRNGIVALTCVASCLVVKCVGAADAKREIDGDDVNSLRKAVLARFDLNHNGRIDSKEKATAYRELLSRDDSDESLKTLRDQVLSQFDKNSNGKLERSEVRSALIAVNVQAQRVKDEQQSKAQQATAQQSYEQQPTSGSRCHRDSSIRQAANAVANDPTAAVALTAQQLTSRGYDTETAEALAIQKFDLNGDGVLDSSELALAQAQTLRQLASLATTTSTLTPIVLTSAATSTGTGTTSTGSSSTGSMAGGCSKSGSSGSTTGSTGSSTSSGSGTTSSAVGGFNNSGFGQGQGFAQGFGNPGLSNFGAQAFGGRRGR